ncbi:9367_t:CDS:2 [Racocetra persica]|uniref:9367_t:CDS:1 n=1 Tax=Racocetra persica TaxID=160502 RepID=A0ACA9LB81_9GLOM|nr:9367_t:CDS:2 [Racocetra persica]
MELEKSNNTPLQTPLNIEKEIFMPQGEPETCLLCNEPEPLFEPNGANLEPITILTYDNNTQIHLKEEEYMVEKLFKYLAKEPQDFGPSSKNMVMETENPTSSEMVFVKIHNKIIQAEKILEEKTREVSRAEYEVLDSYYLLGEALVKKLADFLTNHPLQTARTLLNVEIKRQFPSDMSRNEKMISSELENLPHQLLEDLMKVIQERVRTTFSQPNKLENQLDNLDLNEEGDPMLTD